MQKEELEVMQNAVAQFEISEDKAPQARLRQGMMTTLKARRWASFPAGKPCS